MSRHAKTPGTQRTQRTSRRLNRKTALDLNQRGFTNPEIARQQGVATSTVWRFLQQTKPEKQALEQFKTNRADVLARLQAMSLDAQERIIKTLDDGVVGALTASQKSGLLMSLNAQAGTSFDKERLQRGQSTQNISWASRLIDETVKNLSGKRPQAGAPSEVVGQSSDPPGAVGNSHE